MPLQRRTTTNTTTTSTNNNKSSRTGLKLMSVVRVIVVLLAGVYIVLMAQTQSHYERATHSTGNNPHHPLLAVNITSSTGIHSSKNKQSGKNFVRGSSSVVKETLEKFQTQQRHGEFHPVGRSMTTTTTTRGDPLPKHRSHNHHKEVPLKRNSARFDTLKAPKQSSPKGNPNIIPENSNLKTHQSNLTAAAAGGPASLITDSLISFYNNIPSTPLEEEDNGTTIPNLWENDDDKDNNRILNTTLLPNWMKRYFKWHKHQRYEMQRYGSKIFKQQRWLILQCLGEHDTNCGGTADRLKPIPWAIRVAHNSKRILLIHWTKPGHLEEFLLPPQGGMDWRVPRWLAKMMQNSTWGKKAVPDEVVRGFAMGPKTLIRSRYQSYNGGSYWYNSQLSEVNEVTFEEVFHSVWKILFTPNPLIGRIIETELQRMKLYPGEYVSAHLRALYNRDNRPDSQLKLWAENAINCASELHPGSSIFFTSDSLKATFYAKEYFHTRISTQIIGGGQEGSWNSTNTKTTTMMTLGTREDPDPDLNHHRVVEPLHLDRTKDWRRRPISDFYDAFVDLYLLSLGDGCVTYNKGGYGHMGLMMGANSSCSLLQDALDKPNIDKPCHWVGSSGSGSGSSGDNQTTMLIPKKKQVLDFSSSSLRNKQQPLFLKPMKQDD